MTEKRAKARNPESESGKEQASYTPTPAEQDQVGKYLDRRASRAPVAAQAATLGWRDWEVWGVHRRAPWHRLEGRGLVPTLQGSKIGALTTTEALIVKPNGARLTLRRRTRDPLHPRERALLWQLDSRP